tara:strand:+ start:947 stop:2134 length:1188 start_codon:yes stop_codon:yes gene_type:complete
MSFYKFGPNDIFHNQIKTYPQQSFLIYQCRMFLNNTPQVPGAFVDNVGGVPTGYANLYEMNVDRQASQLIYPFITKAGSLTSFSTISTTNFNNDFAYGDIITGSYPLSATITSSWYSTGAPSTAQPKRQIQSLRTALNSYTPLSPHYLYSSSLGDKLTQEMRIASIPSIFYGSSIKKGSVSVKVYISGTLAAQLVDNLQNGELRQVLPSDGNSGSVAGVALYNEGFLILTGSWDLGLENLQWNNDGGCFPKPARWIDILQNPPECSTDCTSSIMQSASFGLDFKGTQYVPVKTMFAHAARGQLNYSNNPTYLKYGSSSYEVSSGTLAYQQRQTVPIANITSGTWAEPTASFEKTTYISKIGIYDQKRNLIGVAKLANPVRKREIDDFTFKLKLDF